MYYFSTLTISFVHHHYPSHNYTLFIGLQENKFCVKIIFTDKKI